MSFSAATRQRGAVFFVALMVLIVLTLLGLSAAQVTTLQERMSAVYRSDRIAFENAESLLAERERETTISSAAQNVVCEEYYQGTARTAPWQASAGTGTVVENLSRGGSFMSVAGTLEAGIAREIGDKNCLFLQVSAQAHDDSVARNAHTIVQSIYVP
ncbi:PilX N-terminal domain-containing pilus assembly protein [Xanthomonadaceae bacterium JHOS43]|nr:PilX N-terminal domain-containing pilus assembly protein [Xanthomonadaceae bacterium JHOS43]